MRPQIGFSKHELFKSTELLEVIQADEMTLYTKTRKFHWNVAGLHFTELHLLFKTQYNELEEIIDALAERINTMGGKTIGTMNEPVAISRVKEFPHNYPMISEMINELINDHEILVRNLRKDIDSLYERAVDEDTIAFLTGIMELHKTAAWTLRNYFK